MTKFPSHDCELGSSADAAPAHNMHDRGGSEDTAKVHDAAHMPTKERDIPQKSSQNPHSLSIDHLNAHAGASSSLPEIVQHHFPDADLSDTYPAHQAALRRLNGTAPGIRTTVSPSDSGSVTSTQPVLVRPYPGINRAAKSSQGAEMKQKQQPSAESRSFDLPSLESFSFKDILASIDPEIKVSIDTIAEICGRSKMSLADEYDSHLPPQEELNIALAREQGNPEEAPATRLEAVKEAPHSDAAYRGTHRHSLVLGTSNGAHPGLSSVPISTTSNVTSHVHNESFPYKQTNASEVFAIRSDSSSSVLPQILSWLRGSSSRTGTTPNNDASATDALHRLLGDGKNTNLAPM